MSLKKTMDIIKIGLIVCLVSKFALSKLLLAPSDCSISVGIVRRGVVDKESYISTILKGLTSTSHGKNSASTTKLRTAALIH